MIDVRIATIKTLKVDVRYRVPLAIAGGENLVAQHVLVMVCGDDGKVGLGEAAPMPAYSSETQSSIVSAISSYLAPVLVGIHCLDVERAITLMDHALPGNSFAKAAIDIALHDLAARTLGVPVHDLFGGSFRDEVPLAFVIGICDVDKTVEKAVGAVEKGFKTLKLKIGADHESDLIRVAETRKSVGGKVAIRVDGNQGYRSDSAIRILRRMEAYDLELIEQPLPRWDLEGMASVAMALDTPIMCDESVFDSADALRVVRQRAADIINIKIMKPGGLRNARKIVAIAEAAGIPCLIGSMIEFGIGTAAGLHFAATMKDLPYSSELVGPLLLESDVIEDGGFSHMQTPVSLTVPKGPGLGVGLKRRYLREFAEE